MSILYALMYITLYKRNIIMINLNEKNLFLEKIKRKDFLLYIYLHKFYYVDLVIYVC